MINKHFIILIFYCILLFSSYFLSLKFCEIVPINFFMIILTKQFRNVSFGIMSNSYISYCLILQL